MGGAVWAARRSTAHTEAGRPGQAPAIGSHLGRARRADSGARAGGRGATGTATAQPSAVPAPTSTPTAPRHAAGRLRRGGRTGGTAAGRPHGGHAAMEGGGTPRIRRRARSSGPAPQPPVRRFQRSPRGSPRLGDGTGPLPPAPASRGPRRASPCPKPAPNLSSEPHRRHGAPRAAAKAPPSQRGRPRGGRRGRAALLPGSSALQCGPATCTAAGSGAGSGERGAGPALRCGTGAGRGGARRSVRPAGSCSPARRRLYAPRLRRRCGAGVSSAAAPLPPPLPVVAAAPSAGRGGAPRGGKRRRRRRGCPTALWRNG